MLPKLFTVYEQHKHKCLFYFTTNELVKTHKDGSVNRDLVRFYLPFTAVWFLNGTADSLRSHDIKIMWRDIQDKTGTYKLREIVDDNQIRPGIFWTEVAFIIDLTKLTNPNLAEQKWCKSLTIRQSFILNRHAFLGLHIKAESIIEGVILVLCLSIRAQKHVETLSVE